MRRAVATLTCLSVILTAAALHASDLTIERSNQFPSPTVKVPAPDEQFSADWPWHENKLTGDWLGLRGQLAEQGLVFDLRYVSVMMSNTHGGFNRGFVGGEPFGITATLDSEKLLGLEGGTLYIDWEFYNWFNGRFPRSGSFDPTGSYVGVNTNFVDDSQPRLNQFAQLFYRQSLLDGDIVVTFGKLDANAIFVDVDAAGAFQNSIAMFTSTLNSFIPTYPNEATALTLTTVLTESVTSHFGWFDGTSAAYDPTTGLSGPTTGPRGPRTFFDNDGNWFLVTQWDVSWELHPTCPGILGLGAWLQTGRTAAFGTNTEGVCDVPGAYVQWEQTVFASSEEVAADGGGVVYFGQFGWSDPNKNPVHWSLMTGASATGILPQRPADALGLMFAFSQFTDNPEIYQSQRLDGTAGPAGGYELSLEAFYIYQWSGFSYVQPGLMWINQPGGGSSAPLNDALLPYLLVGVEF